MGKKLFVLQSCCCGKLFKGERCHLVKVELEEHRKTVCRGEVQRSCMADHVETEKGN